MATERTVMTRDGVVIVLNIADQQVMTSGGTVIDATIVAAAAGSGGFLTLLGVG